jgi:CHRD domain
MRIMRSRSILTVMAVAGAAVVAACGSDGTTEVVPSTTYVSTLSAANERPNPNTSTATGTATYVLTGNTLTYTVSVNGLSGPATASHIHVGSAAVAGGVIVGYVTAAVQSGTVASGSVDLTQPVVVGASVVPGDSLKKLLETGNAYTNVHTALNPGGEIRGQIIKQ